MTPVPSRRLVIAAAGLAGSALALLAFPDAWPALAAVDLAVALAAAADLAATPPAGSIRATRLAPGRMSVRREHRVTIRVENRSGAALRVRVRSTDPDALGGADEELAGSVPPQGEARWEYPVTPAARGRYAWGPIDIRYRSLLGLWECRSREPAGGEVRVFPDLALLDRYHLLAPADRLAALGVRRVKASGGATEFESLRDYAPGDDARQVDWKATARRGRLIVRDQQAEKNQTVLLLVDSGRLMNAAEGGTAKLDHAVNAALVLARVALGRGDRVGLCTFSAKVHTWLAPRGATAQARLVGEALYDLRADYTETDHGRCLRFLAARHPKRSLLVVLTDFVDATTAAEMVAHLGQAARRHVVLFVALNDPFLRRAAASDALTDRDGFRKAVAIDLLRERREVLERIRHLGGLVVDADPAAVTPPVVNRYLEVVAGGRL